MRWNYQLKDIQKWASEEAEKNPTMNNQLLFCLASVVREMEEEIFGKRKKKAKR